MHACFFCRIKRHLAALTDGDSPVDPVNSLFEDIGFGLLGDAYSKSRNVVVAVETLSADR